MKKIPGNSQESGLKKKKTHKEGLAITNIKGYFKSL